MPTDVFKAMNYAALQHAGQRYNDEAPYTVHLEHVVGVARRFDLHDPEFICACWLHDIIEDTRTSFSDLSSKFTPGVAELVFAVTDERGRDRDERHRKTYPKIRQAGYRAISLKLADRIANVEYGLADPNGKSLMYAREFPEFVKELYAPAHETGPEGNMWRYLARLLDSKALREHHEHCVKVQEAEIELRSLQLGVGVAHKNEGHG